MTTSAQERVAKERDRWEGRADDEAFAEKEREKKEIKKKNSLISHHHNHHHHHQNLTEAAYMMDANGAKSHAAVRARLEEDASDALKALPSVLQGDRDLPPFAAEGATDDLVVNVPDLWSGTDSDVLNMAKKVPFALLHVRHRAGLTHSLAEHAEPSDVASAGLVLHKFLSRQLLGRKEVDFEGKFEEKEKKTNIEDESEL